MTLRKLGALTAFMASALAIALLLCTAVLVLDRQGKASVDRYGSTIANQLAGLSAPAVATQSRPTLNVMMASVADDPAIINAAIFTQDHKLLSSGGRISTEATAGAPDAIVFKSNITFEGQKYGYVRVVIDAATLAPSLQLWLWIAAAFGALLATWCGALLGGRLEKHLHELATRLESIAPQLPDTAAGLHRLHNVAQALAPDPDESGDPAAEGHGATMDEPAPYLVVLNVFNLSSLPTAQRDAVLTRCADQVEQVCELYNGRVARLPNTGLFALFDASDDHDHAFHALCATLLAMRLMTDGNAERSAQGERELAVRAGVLRLTAAPIGSDAAALRAELDAMLTDGTLLSATARNNALLCDREVFQALHDAQRLHWAAVRAPITTSSGETGFHYQITGLTTAVEPLLARQVAKIAQWSATR